MRGAVMNSPIIEFKNVTKRFDNRTILDRINLRIYEGDVTTIIGKSGEGKSVLLKHIIGLLKPDEGSVLIRGRPIEKMKRREWNAYLGQISYMFQNNALFDSKTIYQNVAMPLRKFPRLTKSQIREKVMARLEQTELTEVAHNKPLDELLLMDENDLAVILGQQVVRQRLPCVALALRALKKGGQKYRNQV